MSLDKLFNPRASLAATALLAATLTGCTGAPDHAGHERKYGEFVDDVKTGKVTSVKVESPRVVSFNEGSDQYYSYIPPGASVDDVVNGKVSDYSAVAPKDPPPWMNLLPYLPGVLMIGLFLLMMKQMAGAGKGAMSFGKSKAKLHSGDNDKRVTFDDVAGNHAAKEDLQELVDFLRDPTKFGKLGGKIPKGTLLVGPPGTGKTLLARAVAGEAEVPFYSISGSDFVEMFVGVGASRVRDLFETGKKNAPCIIFIDEIDAVGRQRGAGLGGGHDEREQTLNQLLVEMDGFEGSEGVILIAGTNRPDVLDPALLRPGRFDRQVTVGRPPAKDREDILKVHTRKVPLHENVKLDVLGKGTPGFSGADLANLVNEAALLAGRENKKAVDMSDFERAKDKILAGSPHKSLILTQHEREVTAYHEAAHALVALRMPGADPLHKVSILPRGRALGLTWQMPDGDPVSKNVRQMRAEQAILMAGRLAEEMIFGPDFVTSGASNDIERSTELARNMVTKWGMSELGPIHYAEQEGEVFLGRSMTQTKHSSEETGRQIDDQIRKIVNRGIEDATKIMNEEDRKALHAIAQALLQYEEITGEEALTLANGGSIDREIGSVAFSAAAVAPSSPPPQTFQPRPPS